MNYWLFCKILISSVIFTKVSEGCAIQKNRPVEELLIKNEESPWLVLITDKNTVHSFTLINGISYGAIIHPQLVVTAAIALLNTPIPSQQILANCIIKEKVNCVKRSVISQIFSNEFEHTNVTQEDPVILYLNKPFEFNDKINAIRLVSQNDYPNPDDCVIYHWQPIISADRLENGTKQLGVMHAKYEVSLDSYTFGINQKEYFQIIDDVDCFLESCIESAVLRDSGRVSRSISFVGSPIVCRILTDKSQQVLLGYSTYRYNIIIYNGEESHQGTLIKFPSSIIDFIEEFITEVSDK